MATNLPFHTDVVSQRGRRIQPTEKVKDLLKDRCYTAIQDAITRKNRIEADLRAAMKSELRPGEVKLIYREWSDVCGELATSDVEYRRLAEGEELAKHDRYFATMTVQTQKLADDVSIFLMQQPDEKHRRVVSSVIDDETRRLETRIKKLEEAIETSRLSSRAMGSSSKTGILTLPNPPTYLTVDDGGPRPQSHGQSDVRANPFAPRRASTPRVVTPAAPPPSASTGDDTTSVLGKLVELLDNRKDRLPTMEPEVFKGDVLVYPLWMKSFEALIERNTTSNSEKLFYLGKYTGGDARECVSGYLTLFADDAFDRAKSALHCRYGDEIKIATAYRRRLFSWQPIKKGDGPGLQRFSDFLWQCQAAMETMDHLASLDNADDGARMVKILPTYVGEKWARVVDKWYYPIQDDATHGTRGMYPPFLEFCRLVEIEARIATGPMSTLNSESKESAAKPTKQPTRKAQNFLAQTGDSASKRDDRPLRCHFCQQEHHISECSKFLNKTPEDKHEYAKVKGLCFGCLRRGHSYRVCHSRNPALLKEEGGGLNKQRATTHSVQLCDDVSGEGGYFSLILKMEISHPDVPERSMTIYGLLDTQSDATFVSTDVLEYLGVEGTGVELELVTMGDKITIASSIVNNLQVRGANERSAATIPVCFSRGQIPADRNTIPRRSSVAQWDHLQLVSRQMPEYEENVPIGILIGNNCPAILRHRLVIEDGDDKPYGVYTRVGWGVMGQQSAAPTTTAHCFRTSAKVVTQREMALAFDLPFLEPQNRDEKVSRDDQLFLEKARSSIHRRPDEHYELDLPFRDEPALLPNNYIVAKKRLDSVGRKLRKNAEYRKQYAASMQELIDRGYVKLVTTPGKAGRVNYCPHHSVSHPRKPGRLRGVFDGGAEMNGASLNKLLLTGPDLTNSLVGVLLRFREEEIAFMCDVRGMFLQVGVTEHHRDYLRFLWYEGGDPDAEVLEYQMQTHMFGAASSPGCVNFAFKKMADDYEDEYGADVAEFLRRHFYVDDGLKAMRSVDETVSLFLRANALCERGGFELLKFTCNNAEVLERIPAALLAPSVAPTQLPLQVLPVETSLGLRWDMEADAFVFVLACLTYQPTRRGLLSALSKVYDPIGFLAPIILIGRLLLQRLCLAETGWDDVLPPDYLAAWRKWYDDLEHLPTMCIPRCLKAAGQGEVKVRLHHFSDASCVGYGACSYAQLISADGAIQTHLLLAKARVSPKKAVTIPRLELQAAVVAVTLASTLNRELSYPDITNFFWSDSRVVLGYIQNSARRYHLYVNNRVQQIVDGSEAGSWGHVATDDNPADIASRGCSVTDLKDSDLWWRGPEFIRRADEPENDELFPVNDDDPEVKREIVSHAAVAKRTFLSGLAGDSSEWYPLIRRISWLTRFATYMRARRSPELLAKLTTGPLLVREMRASEHLLLRHAQAEAFPEEYSVLHCNPGYPLNRLEVRARNQRLRRSSNLFKLDVFVDEQGVMRVGGRLRRSFLPLEMKHPAVLPAQHHVTKLYVERAHLLVNHMGRQSTLARLRELGIWLIHGRSAVDRILRDCVTCAKLKRAPEEQKMADLPPERTSEDPPFTHCGVDVFGPVQVKEGRSLKKRWICLFTCLAMRAAHLEVIPSMTTSSFICAFRRLVCRRGPVRSLRSDCGTNFVGARNEQAAMLAELDLPRVQAELLKHECDWVDYTFNPPKASHMGGVWERMGKTMKATLLHLLAIHGEKLSDELLHTVVAETEATLNSRPIVSVDVSDPWAEPPLSPARLLTLKYRAATSPPGRFVDQDIYSNRAWKRAQVIADQFWRQWRTDFLPDLQLRRKWNNQQYNVRAGDIVTMVDDVIPRNQWPLARVMETMPSTDGLVRKVKLQVRDTQLERPISKIIYLCSPDD